MDDKELIQLAAIAAGIDLYTRLDELTQQWTYFVRPALDPWNPLTDDGDSRMLEVALRVDVMWYPSDVWVKSILSECADASEEYSSNNGDRSAALRRAILRVAAEIGKGAVTQNISGSDSNDSGSYSFEVKSAVKFIESDDITDEAKHIAAQFEDGDVTENDLRRFALSSDGLGLDEFNEYIEGDLASMIQSMIDELGGVDSERDEDVVEKLNEFFNFTPPLSSM